MKKSPVVRMFSRPLGASMDVSHALCCQGDTFLYNVATLVLLSSGNSVHGMLRPKDYFKPVCKRTVQIVSRF